MRPLDIAASEYTPRVWFDEKLSRLSVEGESYPENVSAFYDPVFAWLSEDASQLDQLEVLFFYTYLNTSSTKAVLDILQSLEDIHQTNQTKISVIWRYKSQLEVMRETGEELGEDFDVPFQLEAV